jgi:hypothetical protein
MADSRSPHSRGFESFTASTEQVSTRVYAGHQHTSFQSTQPTVPQKRDGYVQMYDIHSTGTSSPTGVVMHNTTSSPNLAADLVDITNTKGVNILGDN